MDAFNKETGETWMLVFRTEVKQSVGIMQRRWIVLGGKEFGDRKTNLSFPSDDHSFGNLVIWLISHHSHRNRNRTLHELGSSAFVRDLISDSSFSCSSLETHTHITNGSIGFGSNNSSCCNFLPGLVNVKTLHTKPTFMHKQANNQSYARLR